MTTDASSAPSGARKGSLLRHRRSIGRDLFTKTEGYGEFVHGMRSTRRWGYRLALHARSGGHALAETDFGERRWVIDGTSNDYLGLAADPRVIAAVAEAVETHGVGSQGATMLNGNTEVHFALERRLAEFLGFEAALLAPSGFAAMQGVGQGLLTPTDVAFADRYCHASIDTGLRIGGSRIYRYPHCDVEALRQLLIDYRDDYQGALIVTDGVFSVEGTIAPVAELVELAQEFECRLMVDDAHGIGALEGGRGCGALPGVDLLAGTLSKGFGSGGGFVVGSAEAIDYLRFFGVSTCTTSNLTVANVAAALAALEIMEAEPERSEHLVSLIGRVRGGLRDAGVDVSDSPTPIINVVMGNDDAAYSAWRTLYDDGLLTSALPFPIVAHGRSAVRIRLNTGMTDEVADRIVEIVAARYAGTPTQQPVASRRSTPGLDETGFDRSMVTTAVGDLAVWERSGASADAPTVVLLHPLLFDAQIWADVVAMLPSEWRLIAVDAPGHGASAIVVDELTLDDLAESAAEVLRARLEGPAVIVGSSMGGMVGLRLAIDHADLTSGLVVIGSSADPEESTSKSQLEPLADVATSIGTEGVIEEVAQVMLSADYVDRAPERCAELMAAVTGAAVEDLVPCVKAVLDRPSIAHELGRISSPTWVLVGDEDVAEPAPHSERMAAGIADASLQIVPSAGHLLQVETPRIVANVIAACVRSAAEVITLDEPSRSVSALR